MFQRDGYASDGQWTPPNGLPHFAPKAKGVIWLFMNGGVSQVDTFDPKPMLEKYHGQPMPGGAIATERRTGALMKSPFAFRKYGKSGIEVSDLFPSVGGQVDDICVIRSMYTDIPNHEPSLLMMNTGHTQVGRPSMGSWPTYGLGTDNKNLPGFVVLCPETPTTVGSPLWEPTRITPSTLLDSIRASENPAMGGESNRTKSNTRLHLLTNSNMRSDSSNATGFGGKGPAAT